MPTTIQIDERTKKMLFKFVLELEKKEKRNVSYDEAIKHLMARCKKTKKLLDLRGCINREKAYKDLGELKLLEQRRHEHLAGISS